MAGFLSGFATGFMNQASKGIEDENKARYEKERDFDRIATTNIFETARDFQKEHAKVTGDLKKTAERYNTFLPMVNNNEAAAELLAKSDTHTSDTDKISEIFSRFNNPESQGYKSNLMDQMQKQLESQNDLTRNAVDKANGMIPKGSKLQPFTHSDYSPMNVQASTVPPSMPTISARVHDRVMQAIVDDPSKFKDANSAIAAYKARLSAAAPNMPIPSDQEIAQKFAGIEFGKPTHDPAAAQKMAQWEEYHKSQNPEKSPDEIHQMALASSLGAQPKLDPLTHESLKKNFLPLVDPVIAAFGKATYTQDAYGNGQMTFPGNMKEGDQEKLIKARGYAMGAFRKDMEQKKPSHDPTEYAYWGLRRSGYWDDQKYQYEMKALEAANSGTEEPPRPVNPKTKIRGGAQQAQPAPTAPAVPTQPGVIQYDANGNRIQ